MKKLVLLILIPVFSFSQNPKTEKVLNDLNTAATVVGNVLNIFKKDKNKTDNKTPNKTTAISNSDGKFSVNAKPEDIVASVYKCTYKKLEDDNYCVWKPTATEINKLKQSNQDNDWLNLNDPKIMFATVVADALLTFKQNGIDNIVIATNLNSYSTDDKNVFIGGAADIVGFVRFQTTDGKRMKLASNNMVLTEMRAFGTESSILKLDENNIFYSVPSFEGGFASYSKSLNEIYSLDGKFMLSYVTAFISGGKEQESNEMQIDQANKLIKIVEPHVTTDKKGKVIKTTYKTVATYQYGNGTITEIKQPAVKKTTTTKKKK